MSGQLDRDARRPRMDLGADVVADHTHDALAVLRRQSHPGVAQTSGQAVDPQPAVRIEHDLNDGRSSSQLVIAPIAARTMPMLRDAGSGLTKTDPIVVPKFATAWVAVKCRRQLRGTVFGKFNN
jgi:hypothetical protein